MKDRLSRPRNTFREGGRCQFLASEIMELKELTMSIQPRLTNIFVGIRTELNQGTDRLISIPRSACVRLHRAHHLFSRKKSITMRARLRSSRNTMRPPLIILQVQMRSISGPWVLAIGPLSSCIWIYFIFPPQNTDWTGLRRSGSHSPADRES
jgi:hypothetical protein